MVDSKDNLKIISFYRFVRIKNVSKIKIILDDFLKNRDIKGTVLLSSEGINGSLSGNEKELFIAIVYIKKNLNIRKLNFKSNNVSFFPFKKMKIKLKKEIVTLGAGKININKLSAKHIHPRDWNKTIKQKRIKLIDVRNPYEIKIGKFSKSINPSTTSFRQFPEKFKKLKINKNETIAMYCTGGIRCEKASAYLKLQGYKKVLQLEGGILNYFDYYCDDKQMNKWKGQCFVFDDRITVKKDLRKGNYVQCYGCRSPLTKKQIKSPLYVRGVSCPNCFNIRTKKQRDRSYSRLKQTELRKK